MKESLSHPLCNTIIVFHFGQFLHSAIVAQNFQQNGSEFRVLLKSYAWHSFFKMKKKKCIKNIDIGISDMQI